MEVINYNPCHCETDYLKLWVQTDAQELCGLERYLGQTHEVKLVQGELVLGIYG